jgi:rhodanese-related sulfurtransferase
MNGDHPSPERVELGSSPPGEVALVRVATPYLGIVLTAAIIGLSVNALRDRDSIELGRTYFASPPPVPSVVVPPADPGTSAAPAAPVRKARSDLPERAAREFTVIDAARALDLSAAAHLDASHVQFVDARSAAHFRKDHLPGALLLDYYNLRRDIAPALPFLQLIPWLVVYCESIECEDGYLLCRALRDDYGFPKERLLLYLDGIRDWRARRLPLARGDLPW